jgi:tetratricopeptide (TPR) repeat protein
VTGYDRAARPTVEVAHEALIRTWPRLRQWIDSIREKLRSRTAILQAKTDWEQNRKREDMLLPAGLQLERARSLLADPGDIGTDDIKEFILLSSAREQAERKEREEALERDKAQVAEIKAAQARTADAQARIASSQWITRWAFAAVAAVILIGGGIVGWLQADKAQKLAALNESLNRRQVALDHAQANILAEVSTAMLSRNHFDSALRLASRGTRIDLALPVDKTRASPAAAALCRSMRALYEKTLGPEHPFTAASLSHLARLLYHQGDRAGLLPMAERALAIYEKTLGPERPFTAMSLSDLARLLHDQGNLAAARPLYERALARCEKAVGPEHPSTNYVRCHLSCLLLLLGRPTEAVTLSETALTAHDKALGRDHAWTKDSARVTADALEALAAQRKRRRCGRSMG